MAKGRVLLLPFLILVLGCAGLSKMSAEEGPGMFKEMKIKRMLRSEQAKEIQQMSGGIGVVKVGSIEINNIGTRGEIAMIQVLEHDLVSWNEKKLDRIEIRRHTTNADTVLKTEKYYFVMLSPISGSHEYFWLNDYQEVQESATESVMALVRKEYNQ